MAGFARFSPSMGEEAIMEKVRRSTASFLSLAIMIGSSIMPKPIWITLHCPEAEQMT